MTHSRCPNGMLGVKKKGYHRREYTKKSGTSVKATDIRPTSFCIEDLGEVGRGRKVIPPLKKGSLGGKGFFSRTEKARRKHEVELAKKLGEKKVAGKLRAVGVFQKTTNPKVSRKAFADARYISGSFKDKRKVEYPKGFGRNKRR